MDRARCLCSTIVRRRSFVRSIAGLALGAVAAELPFGAERSSKTVGLDHDYLIVNGWVLTREDLGTVRVALNVV
jgi:hypothetical protein